MAAKCRWQPDFTTISEISDAPSIETWSSNTDTSSSDRKKDEDYMPTKERFPKSNTPAKKTATE